jgi:hypothetical protein
MGIRICKNDMGNIFILLSFFSLVLMLLWPTDIIYESINFEQVLICEDGRYVQFLAEVESYDDNKEVLRVCGLNECINVHLKKAINKEIAFDDPNLINQEILIMGEVLRYHSNRYLEAHHIRRVNR